LFHEKTSAPKIPKKKPGKNFLPKEREGKDPRLLPIGGIGKAIMDRIIGLTTGRYGLKVALARVPA